MDKQTAQDSLSVSTEQNDAIDTTIGTVNDPSANDNIVNLYSTIHKQSMRKSENPFMHQLLLHSVNGEIT